MERIVRLTVNGEMVTEMQMNMSGDCDLQLAPMLSRIGRTIRSNDNIQLSIRPLGLPDSPGLPGINQWRAELLVTESLPFDVPGKIAVVQYGLITAVADAQIRVVQFGGWVAHEGDDI